MRPDWTDVLGAGILGVFIGLLIGLFIADHEREAFHDESVKRGYAEYVIKDKQAVWQWKEQK